MKVRCAACAATPFAIIFQNPATAFNPVFTIGTQMRDVLAAHDRERGVAATARMREVLGSVGMPDVDRVMRAYPHQLSGGMLQRAMIAMALLCRPRLLIADEPTTALDVTIAAQILALLRQLQQAEGFSVLLITHDLGVVRRVCDRVAVLYAGRVVETAGHADAVRGTPASDTRGLLAAVPRTAASGPLRTIPGSVPADLATYHRLRVRTAVSHHDRRLRHDPTAGRPGRSRPCSCLPPPRCAGATPMNATTPGPTVGVDASGAPSAVPDDLVRITDLVKTYPAQVPGRGTVTIRALDGVSTSRPGRRTASWGNRARARRRSRAACCG